MARKHKMDRLKLYLMIGLPSETDADIDECVAFTDRAVEDRPGLARHRAVLREAKHADGRPDSPGSTSSTTASIALKRASTAAPTCARPARSGRGSSTCSRKAARPKGSLSSMPSPPEVASPTTKKPSPRFRHQVPEPAEALARYRSGLVGGTFCGSRATSLGVDGAFTSILFGGIAAGVPAGALTATTFLRIDLRVVPARSSDRCQSPMITERLDFRMTRGLLHGPTRWSFAGPVPADGSRNA